MVTLPTPSPRSTAAHAPERAASFADWRRQTEALGLPPIVAVGGSRGKTTVVRLLDEILRAAGLRTALWTNSGVEIIGRQQQGELGPWSRAVQRLGAGSLDVAIQELDWATIHAVGLPAASYPIIAITNLCVNSELCLVQAETARALSAAVRLREAVHPKGVAILNGEDFAVGAAETVHSATVLVGHSRETPLLRSHLVDGGTATWADEGAILVGTDSDPVVVTSLANIPLIAGGAVGFQLQNTLIAATAALTLGISTDVIATAIGGYVSPVRRMPGSFNVLRFGGAIFVVDRPAPPWFLRPALRAISNLPSTRLLTVVGRLNGVAAGDLVETGRLLGRSGGAIILHGEADDPTRAGLLRQGIAANDVPPVIVRVATERQAVSRALAMLQPDDLAFVLADHPLAVLRALDRAKDRKVA